ncbi:MAG: hypothetical protein AAGB51_03650 [Planctomycetota bacterium]
MPDSDVSDGQRTVVVESKPVDADADPAAEVARMILRDERATDLLVRMISDKVQREQRESGARVRNWVLFGATLLTLLGVWRAPSLFSDAAGQALEGEKETIQAEITRHVAALLDDQIEEQIEKTRSGLETDLARIARSSAESAVSAVASEIIGEARNEILLESRIELLREQAQLALSNDSSVDLTDVRAALDACLTISAKDFYAHPKAPLALRPTLLFYAQSGNRVLIEDILENNPGLLVNDAELVRTLVTVFGQSIVGTPALGDPASEDQLEYFVRFERAAQAVRYPESALPWRILYEYRSRGAVYDAGVERIVRLVGDLTPQEQGIVIQALLYHSDAGFWVRVPSSSADEIGQAATEILEHARPYFSQLLRDDQEVVETINRISTDYLDPQEAWRTTDSGVSLYEATTKYVSDALADETRG